MKDHPHLRQENGLRNIAKLLAGMAMYWVIRFRSSIWSCRRHEVERYTKANYVGPGIEYI